MERAQQTAAQQTAAQAEQLAAAIIARHSKSFALASKLLPEGARQDAIALYAYCRRVDDAVDNAPVHEQAAALDALRVELTELYAGVAQADPLLGALQSVIERRAIPRFCFDDLLLGMEMDVRDTAYATLPELLLYCYRVAGTVGLMMCHVMGVRDPEALEHAKDLGSAMQLTNIARDVLEDWERGRLYLPDALLSEAGAGTLRSQLDRTFPTSAAAAVSRTTAALLEIADRYYRSGDAGVRYLLRAPDSTWLQAFRCAAAVYAARLVYSSIGSVLWRRGCDPLAGRAVVPTSRKLLLALRALVVTAFAFAWACTWSACAHEPAFAPAHTASRTLAGETSATPQVAPAPTASAVAPDVAPPASMPTPVPITAPTAAPQAMPAGQVVVDISGLQSTEGQLLVAIYRSGKGFPDKGAKAFGKRVAKLRANRARIVFDAVPPGPFAITVHHDANKDFAMDTGLFGMPQEGYGFSRDASAPFGPPDFASARLTLAPSETKHVPIHMKY